MNNDNWLNEKATCKIALEIIEHLQGVHIGQARAILDEAKGIINSTNTVNVRNEEFAKFSKYAESSEE